MYCEINGLPLILVPTHSLRQTTVLIVSGAGSRVSSCLDKQVEYLLYIPSPFFINYGTPHIQCYTLVCAVVILVLLS